MQRTSLRDYHAWLEWEQRQWNKPSRTDHYLMQIAQTVVQSNSRIRLVLNSFRIPFTFSSQRTPTAPDSRSPAQAKSKWFAFTGFKRKKQSNE